MHSLADLGTGLEFHSLGHDRQRGVGRASAEDAALDLEIAGDRNDSRPEVRRDERHGRVSSVLREILLRPAQCRSLRSVQRQTTPPADDVSPPQAKDQEISDLQAEQIQSHQQSRRTRPRVSLHVFGAGRRARRFFVNPTRLSVCVRIESNKEKRLD